jgi:hypothetical protein
MPRRIQMYPYPVSDGIVLRIKDPWDPTDEEVELDWNPAGDGPEEQLQFDLRGEKQWAELQFGVEARLDTAALAEVLPPKADFRKDAALIVSVRCPSTKLRLALRLDPDPKEDGLWAGDVHLRRKDVRSRIELLPTLTRTTEIPQSAVLPVEVARPRFALLAAGRTFAVQTDYVERTFNSPVKIKWEDFRGSKNPWRAAHGGTLYFLEPDVDEPVLWLNSYTAKLKALLLDRSDNTTDAGLRVVLATWLAETVWMQLFHAALGSVAAPDNDELASLPDGWRGDLLRRYLSIMFPDTVDDVPAALVKALAMRQSRDENATLLALATTATQEIVSSQKQLYDAVRHIERAE